MRDVDFPDQPNLIGCYLFIMPAARETAQMLREQAARCRRLAEGIADTETARRLLEMASELDERAEAAEARGRTG